jgi:TPR repeat protein
VAIKVLVDQAKNHPVIVAIALFACIVVGSFASFMYIEVSKQRASLLDDRIAQLENDTQKQKKINKIIIGQIGALQIGYKQLPKSLVRIKNEFEYVSSLNFLDESKRKNIDDLIDDLAGDVRQVEIALAKSEAIIKTFDSFLNASKAEADGRFYLAAQSYAMAARLGNVDAQHRLATLYARGLGVPKDLEEASYWYKQAAMRGNTEARAELAQLYYSGRGVKKDRVNALVLWELAKKDVPISAQEKIASILEDLTPQEIEDAKKLKIKYLEEYKTINLKSLKESVEKTDRLIKELQRRNLERENTE